MIGISILAKVLPVIVLLVAGILMRNARFLSEQTVGELKKFVVNFSLPALLFIAFLNTDFQTRYLWIIVITFTINFVMLVVGKALNGFIAKTNPYFPLMFTGFEMGMLGFSLFGTVYGLQSLSTFGLFDLGQEAYVWFVLTTLLIGLKHRARAPKTVLVSFATSPVIIGICLGVVINLLGIRQLLTTNVLTGAVLSTISMVSQLTIPLILLIIGYQLNLRVAGLRLPFITLLVRMLVMIAFAILIDHFLFDRLLHLPALFSAALFTMFILPPPFIIPLFIEDDMKDHQEYVSNTLSLGTIMTVIAFIIVAIVYK